MEQILLNNTDWPAQCERTFPTCFKNIWSGGIQWRRLTKSMEQVCLNNEDWPAQCVKALRGPVFIVQTYLFHGF